MESKCLKYYSKLNCPSCDKMFNYFKEKYNNCYEKITITDNETALKTVNNFGVRSFPFLVDKNSNVINNREIFKFLKTFEAREGRT